MPRELFVTLAATQLAVAALYTLLRPDLAVRAYAWCRPRARRVAAGAGGGLLLLLAIAVIGEARAHPSVDAAGESALWTTTTIRLGAVAAADLRWQAALPTGRPAAVEAVRRATRELGDAVHALERARPPDGMRATHLAATAVYRDLSEVLADLPDALARTDIDAAAGIWRRAGMLNEEAASLVLLTVPPAPTPAP